MPIGPFDTIEVITLLINLIAFLYIYKAYKEGINTPESKKFWTYFLLIATFVLLNRIFTNVETLAFKSFFNLVEHLSTLVAAFIFVLITKNTLKGETSV
jgi:MFS-type transporter involved in bile tolerance (Atg22 family)